MQIRDLIPWGWGRQEVSRREEEDPFRSLQAEINKAFGGFWRAFERPGMARGGGGGFGMGMPALAPFAEGQPRVDVAETDKEIEVTAELPGMDEKDVEVAIARDSLTIRGEKRHMREEKHKDYHFSERSFGTIQRTIPLPAGVDTDKVEANFKNGVLTVKVPKVEGDKSEVKKIAVKKG